MLQNTRTEGKDGLSRHDDGTIGCAGGGPPWERETGAEKTRKRFRSKLVKSLSYKPIWAIGWRQRTSSPHSRLLQGCRQESCSSQWNLRAVAPSILSRLPRSGNWPGGALILLRFFFVPGTSISILLRWCRSEQLNNRCIFGGIFFLPLFFRLRILNKKCFILVDFCALLVALKLLFLICNPQIRCIEIHSFLPLLLSSRRHTTNIDNAIRGILRLR